MANIFEQFGIKEVADVHFEALEDEGTTKAGDVVLFLDTLKVSTAETTAEQSEARGGKGNPSLIIWDFGREITVSLQDALMSMASQKLMNGAKLINDAEATVRINERITIGEGTSVTLKATPAEGTKVRYINFTKGTSGTSTGTFTTKTFTFEASEMAKGDIVQLFYDTKIASGAVTVVINASTFPGTYKVYGDTFIRNQNGKDFPYQFVINRAKVSSNTTLTLEAEGDPSVFDMDIRVLRDAQGNMISYTRYELPA